MRPLGALTGRRAVELAVVLVVKVVGVVAVVGVEAVVAVVPPC